MPEYEASPNTLISPRQEMLRFIGFIVVVFYMSRRIRHTTRNLTPTPGSEQRHHATCNTLISFDRGKNGLTDCL